MKQFLASILLLAACGGGPKRPTAQAHAGDTEPSVDPTVPSWLPQSCFAYHKAVVQAIDCQAVDQTKRDEIKNTFDAKSVSWKAEQHGDKARVDEIGATCTSATQSIRADIGEKCI
jgi:hypothetical protein